MRRLVIATRGSDLAMWQAGFVADALAACHGGLEIELRIVRTRGDKLLDSPPAKLDKGMFTREIQKALLAGSADLTVHSLKDLPIEGPDGLRLAAVAARQDPADALVAKGGLALKQLPPGAKVLAGSPRRKAQLLHVRSDLVVLPVRGNVDTRLRKLDTSDAEAMVLARAGLVRLGLAGRITERLDPGQFLPACGQGALAVEVRSDEAELADLLAAIDDGPTRAATGAERAFLAGLGGGCRVPAGAYAAFAADGRTLSVVGMIAEPDGRRLTKRTVSGDVGDVKAAEALGRRLAEGVLAASKPDPPGSQEARS